MAHGSKCKTSQPSGRGNPEQDRDRAGDLPFKLNTKSVKNSYRL